MGNNRSSQRLADIEASQLRDLRQRVARDRSCYEQRSIRPWQEEQPDDKKDCPQVSYCTTISSSVVRVERCEVQLVDVSDDGSSSDEDMLYTPQNSDATTTQRTDQKNQGVLVGKGVFRRGAQESPGLSEPSASAIPPDDNSGDSAKCVASSDATTGDTMAVNPLTRRLHVRPSW